LYKLQNILFEYDDFYNNNNNDWDSKKIKLRIENNRSQQKLKSMVEKASEENEELK
jgi:hypothetical protein